MTGKNGADRPLVFVSYSKHDRAWKDDYLLVHLDGLEMAGLVTVWNDDDIDSGGKWLPPLVKAMHEAHVAVCLISPHYLKTKFIVNEEIPYLLQRSEKEGLHLKFMLVEPCAWRAHRWLSERQMFLKKGACVRTDYEGRENLPFAMLAEHLLELLPEAAPDDADEPLPVSPRIKEAIAKMKTDSETTMANFSAAEVAAAREGSAIFGNKTLSGGFSWPEIAKILKTNNGQGDVIGGVMGGILGGGQRGYSTTVPAPDDDPTYAPLPEQLVNVERLPVTGAELFGRQAELAMLDEAWASGTTTIVSLVAWGGVGKSTLLNKWVESLAGGNYRGARRVFAWSFYSQGTNERATSADAFIDEALRFFEDPDPTAGSAWSKGERLADLVGQEKALLLLDGMEPLQDAYQGIKDPALSRLIECLADRNDGLCVITTREPVKEFEGFPESTLQQNLEQISPEAGRALLRVRGIRGSDAELEAASVAFGNHALAINLLASFLKDCEGRHIQFAGDIPALADLDDPNHRHPRRVMAAFAERFDEGPELDLLHMMGLFDRPADDGCIKALRVEPAVPGLTEKLSKLDEAGWLKLLAKLRDLGLLAPASHHDPDELDAHPLVREHFGAALRDEHPDAWQTGHLRLYMHLQTLPQKDQPDTLDQMIPLYRAILHACEAKAFLYAITIYVHRIHRSPDFYGWRQLGSYSTDLAALSAFFDKSSSSLVEGAPVSLTPMVLNPIGLCTCTIGYPADAVPIFRNAWNHVVKPKPQHDAATIIINLSEALLGIGNLRDVKAAAEEGYAMASQYNQDFLLLVSCSTLANVEHQMGNNEAALTLFEEAEKQQCEHRPELPKLYSLRGYYYFDFLLALDRLDETEERANWLLEVSQTRATLGRLDLALSHLACGRAAVAHGNLLEANRAFNQSIDSFRMSGDLMRLPLGLLARAALFREAGEFALSRKDFDEAMRIAKRGEMRLHQCDAHRPSRLRPPRPC